MRQKRPAHPGVIACLALLAGAGGFAQAQPPSIDLGTLAIPGQAIDAQTLAPAGVVWFTFELPAIDAAALTWLDLDTAESLVSNDDTMLALFGSSGALIASDDNDASGLLSALSFGRGSGMRPRDAGVISNGRDGATLPAGRYYAAVSASPTAFSSLFGAATTHTASGVVELRVETGSWVPEGQEEWSELAAAGASAGDLPATAQVVEGSGPLSSIRGVLDSPTDVDLYRIRVCDPALFVATLVSGAQGIGARYDTQAWLFFPDGRGVSHNDNSAGTLAATLTGLHVPGAGEYLLAISGYNRDPLSAEGLPLWLEEPSNLERVPDGAAATSSVALWNGEGAYGTYKFVLNGACFIDAEPTCPADIDDGSFTGTPDGGVTIEDLLYFLAEFEVGGIGADLDDGNGTGTPDGGVTVDDLIFFLDRFLLGC